MTSPTEPTTPGATDGTTDATGSSTTGTTATAPNGAANAFDLKTLPPEAQAHVTELLRRADEKARTTSKANAAREAKEELLRQLGQEPTVDPKTLVEQNAAKDAKIRLLLAERQIAAAARKAGADEALLTAVLAHGGKLSALDPESADFASQVETIVKAEVAANPRLLANATAPLPAVGQGATAQFNNGNASTGQLTQADLDDMTARGDTAGIAKALKDGKLRTLLGG